METQEKLYQRGFNNGYMLSKHKPELLNKLSVDLKPGNEFINGVLAGKEQHEKELNKSKIKTLAKSKAQDLQKTNGKSKDIRATDLDIDR